MIMDIVCKASWTELSNCVCNWLFYYYFLQVNSHLCSVLFLLILFSGTLFVHNHVVTCPTFLKVVQKTNQYHKKMHVCGQCVYRYLWDVLSSSGAFTHMPECQSEPYTCSCIQHSRSTQPTVTPHQLFHVPQALIKCAIYTSMRLVSK